MRDVNLLIGSCFKDIVFIVVFDIFDIFVLFY